MRPGGAQECAQHAAKRHLSKVVCSPARPSVLLLLHPTQDISSQCWCHPPAQKKYAKGCPLPLCGALG